jgi:transcriptional regulator with XRE-family HTH domain
MTGDRERKIRIRLNLTQAQLAERVGVTRNTVTLWELGLMRIRESAAILLKHLAELRVENTTDVDKRWLTAPRARSSTKQRHLPARRGEKTLGRAQHDQHNEMLT